MYIIIYDFLYSGIAKQCGNIPTRFIVELLNKQQRIVLTGKGIDSIRVQYVLYDYGMVLVSACLHFTNVVL